MEDKNTRAPAVVNVKHGIYGPWAGPRVDSSGKHKRDTGLWAACKGFYLYYFFCTQLGLRRQPNSAEREAYNIYCPVSRAMSASMFVWGGLLMLTGYGLPGKNGRDRLGLLYMFKFGPPKITLVAP